MALSIQSNMASKAIQNQLGRTNNDLSVALERLGSGFRINSAKDDAAGLQIANRLNAQVRGQEAAIYNANNANSMLQTAEGAFEEMTNIAFRMKELATQGANGTNNTS
ncbi:MAG TPA: flagellin, partial [Rheinheimera sp.]|nr:flagellin [Rheinheimera sp.]